MSYNEPAISRIGITHEQEHALIDARDFIWERGEQLIIRLNQESTITRDKYNSIKKRSTPATELTLYSYPIIFSPTTKEKDRAGIKEDTQLIAYTSMLDWNNNDFDLDRLNKLDSIKMTIIYRDRKYELKEKSLNSQFSNSYLYVVLGLNRI